MRKQKKSSPPNFFLAFFVFSFLPFLVGMKALPNLCLSQSFFSLLKKARNTFILAFRASACDALFVVVQLLCCRHSALVLCSQPNEENRYLYLGRQFFKLNLLHFC